MREAREPHATLVVNEGFDYTVAIDQLNAMESTQKCSIHVNFTVVPPKMQTGSIERFRSDVSDSATTCLFHEQAISCCPGKFLYPRAFERFRLRSHLLSCAAQNLHTECTFHFVFITSDSFSTGCWYRFWFVRDFRVNSANRVLEG